MTNTHSAGTVLHLQIVLVALVCRLAREIDLPRADVQLLISTFFETFRQRDEPQTHLTKRERADLNQLLTFFESKAAELLAKDSP